MKLLPIIIVLLLIMIFIPKTVSATAPTITTYGISPVNAPIGTLIKIWMTYTDTDNDAPTYVRVERYQVPNLQPPIYNMVANNTGDTTYNDGKQYYYDWYYFPFTGTGFIQIQIKSGADAQVIKNIVEYQEPAPRLRHSGITPMNNTPGNYTFFTNYTDVFNGIPTYVQVKVDGITHSMNKNNSSQVSWITGVDYSYTENLIIGNHTYSFEALSLSGNSGKQSGGTNWIMIINQTSPQNIDWNLIGITGIIIGLIIIILSFALFREKEK